MTTITISGEQTAVSQRVAEECPNANEHTPSPEGYIQWHAWAGKMNRTHRQIRCSGCGLYKIWVKRTPRDQNEAPDASVGQALAQTAEERG